MRASLEVTESMIADGKPRSLAEIVMEAKEELKEFVVTRVKIFAGELQEKATMLAIIAALAGIAVLLFLTAYLLFVVALVVVIANLLHGSSMPVLFACLIMGGVSTILGFIAAYNARASLHAIGFLPTKTMAVLKLDKVWLQGEVGNRA